MKTLTEPCPACGRELSRGARYCPGCGGNVPELRAALAAKLVAVKSVPVPPPVIAKPVPPILVPAPAAAIPPIQPVLRNPKKP